MAYLQSGILCIVIVKCTVMIHVHVSVCVMKSSVKSMQVIGM